MLFKSYKEKIDRALIQHFSKFEGPLKEASLYALMGGGRRIRPIICLLIAENLAPNCSSFEIESSKEPSIKSEAAVKNASPFKESLASCETAFNASLANDQAAVKELIANDQAAVNESMANQVAVKEPGVNCETAFKELLVDCKMSVKEPVIKCEAAVRGAIAIECFHTASLIADDLPCMDDDDMRRGVPATHKRFGEAVAILTTYALIAEGYGQLSLCNSAHLNLLLQETTLATGLLGASQGQLLDLYGKNSEEMIEKKTGSLFELSFIYGWIFGGGDIKFLDQVRKAASHFGLAFQIYDDLQDMGEEGVNVAANLGIDQALELFHVHLDAFKALSKDLGLTKLLELVGFFSNQGLVSQGQCWVK